MSMYSARACSINIIFQLIMEALSVKHYCKKYISIMLENKIMINYVSFCNAHISKPQQIKLIPIQNLVDQRFDCTLRQMKKFLALFSIL